MNQKRLNVLLVCVFLLMVGCTVNRDDQKKDLNNENDEVQSVTSPAAEPHPVSEFELKGDIRNVYYAGEDKILVSADKLYLYDVKTESVLNEAPKEDFDQENIWVTEDGYVAIRLTRNSSDSSSMSSDGKFNMIVKFYDQELNEVSDFFLNQLYEDDELLISIEPISFSSDGKQMVYATTSALYLYDFEKREKSVVVDLISEDIEKRSGIVHFEQLSFTNGDKQIVFKAQSLQIPIDPNKPSFDTCGVVNVDGSKLSNHTFGDYICKEIMAYNNTLLFTEDPTVVTGRTLVMELPEEETKFHKLIDVAESRNVWGSNDGEYFATSILTKIGWKIRVYNMKTGKLEMEQQVSSDDSRYLEQDPVIKVVDDSRTYIVLLGSRRDDIQTKMVIGQF